MVEFDTAIAVMLAGVGIYSIVAAFCNATASCEAAWGCGSDAEALPPRVCPYRERRLVPNHVFPDRGR